VLREPDGLFIRVLASMGYAPAVIEAFRRFSMNEHLPLVDAIRSGEPIWLESAKDWEERYFTAPDAYASLRDRQAWAAVPFDVDEQLRGALGLGIARARPFTDAEKQQMIDLAQHIAGELRRITPSPAGSSAAS